MRTKISFYQVIEAISLMIAMLFLAAAYIFDGTMNMSNWMYKMVYYAAYTSVIFAYLELFLKFMILCLKKIKNQKKESVMPIIEMLLAMVLMVGSFFICAYLRVTAEDHKHLLLFILVVILLPEFFYFWNKEGLKSIIDDTPIDLEINEEESSN